ncbi:gephyrin-like molybdotransferase Glp [Cognatishimia maritima]|uniref:Molybdopterin molybdenumtransferase n=1 Tax=Cognatishimia maritima TaxID=870908 RepID=A0A1M5RRI6_9RHOB|nr:gephyrin-like molybdotransferase Glp [Cognatishimia maritima]SHH28922.1 molybdopterin molybdochelatase [Cognatishimia maritima]
MTKDKLTPPPLKNDCFALPPGVHWTPVDEAQALLRDRLGVAVGQETVLVADAMGRVLAAPVLAQRSNPPTPNSAVDGYALNGAAFGEGVHYVPLQQGRSAAGSAFQGKVPQGHALRILTGASMPAGTDTVVLQEDVTLGDGEIAFQGPLKPGANARKAGEDFNAGDEILPAGHRVRAQDMALLAASGARDIEAYRTLRVAVLSTGDELIEAGDSAAPDQIYDANRPMLLSMARRLGYEVVDIGRIADDRDTLRAALNNAAASADVILSSGGASAGDEDHMSALLQDAGVMALWRMAIKPGRPLALGLWEGTPVFGLPGNPVAACVCALIFALPAMSILAGEGWQVPKGVMLPALFTKRKKAGRREYLRARRVDEGVEVFASEGSGRISGLSWADGLVELPDEAMEITPGTPVRYFSYRDFGL